MLIRALVLMLLSGCATIDRSYWFARSGPLRVNAIIEQADARAVCMGAEQALAGGTFNIVHGCFDRVAGIVYLQTGMVPSLRECVLRHELRHAAGYDHAARFDPEIEQCLRVAHAN